MSKSTKAESPAARVVKFLEFRRQISETMNEIASIEATVSSANETRSEDGSSSILHEIQHNSIDQEKNASKRRTTAVKQQQRHKQLRSNDENKKPSAFSGLGNIASLAREIEKEAAHWFMGFIENALEKGMQKSQDTGDADVKKVPRSLILQVGNW